MMKGRQKIYFLLDKIQDKRELTPKWQPVLIHPAIDLNNKYPKEELQQLLTKLAEEAFILRVVFEPEVSQWSAIDHDKGYYGIEILPKFDEYYLEIQNEPGYQEFTGKPAPKRLNNKLFQQQISEQALRPTPLSNYGNKPTVNKLSPKEIAGKFLIENKPFVLMVLQQILLLADFTIKDQVSYQLQSPHGQQLMQERALLAQLELWGVFKNLGEDGIFGIATLEDVDVESLKEIIRELENRYEGVISEEEFGEIKEKYQDLKVDDKVHAESISKTDAKSNSDWPDDFRWDGKRFIFGDYGQTGLFNSKIKRGLFRALTDARGSWVTVRKLKEITESDKDYVRPTIGQIQRGLNKNLRRFIAVVSTKEDNFQPKPSEGAYRIKFTPNPL